MKNLALFFFILSFFVCCAKKNCSNHALIIAALDATFKSQDLQPYLRSDTNVVVLKIDTILESGISFEKFNRPVLFLSKSEIDEKKIKIFLEFEEIKMVNDSIDIRFRIKFSGASGWMKYKIVDCELKQTYSRLGLSD